MSRIAIHRDTMPFCFQCGWRPVPENGRRCPACIRRSQRGKWSEVAKVVYALIISALLAMAAKWAFATNKQISAESVRVSHYSEARAATGLQSHPSAPCCNTATAPHKRGVTTGFSCRDTVRTRAGRTPSARKI